jgi:hypothetical protein
VDQVDAVKHLGAAGAREGLADAEELLVLSDTVSSSAIFPHSWDSTYHLLVDPLQLGNKLVMELATKPSVMLSQRAQNI